MQLILVFAVLSVIGCVVTATFMKPGAYEKAIRLRISDVRNPKRPLADGLEMAGLTLSSSTSFREELKSYVERYTLVQKFRRWIDQADHPSSFEGLLLKVAGSGLSGWALASIGAPSIAAILIGLACSLLPLYFIERRRRKRLKAISMGLPDTTELMARALRSGHSMTQTIEVLAEQAPLPLNTLFQQVFQQQKVGLPLRDVLVDTVNRVPCRDLQFLMTAVLVQRETGGDLGEVLDRTAQVLRDRIQVQGEIAVYTAQGRLTGWILSLLPVVLLGVMTVASPGYSRVLLDDPAGRKLLLIGAVLIGMGGLMIRKLIRVQL